MTKSPTVQNSPAAHIPGTAFIANPGVYRRDFPEMGKRPDYYDAELMIPGTSQVRPEGQVCMLTQFSVTFFAVIDISSRED